MRGILLKLFFLVSVSANAQYFNPLFHLDTLKSNYHIGGELDSIDLFIGSQSSTITGGGWNVVENTFNPQFLHLNPNGQRYYSYLPKLAITFSGLPHIGFSYSFGSKGTQFTAMEYQQTFKHGLIVNMTYQKFRSNGFYRQGNFDHNNVHAAIFRKGKIYSMHLNASYASSNVQSNGGLSADSLPRYYDLIFIPIRKEDAILKSKRTNINLDNYLNFLNDSLKAFGLYTNHAFRGKEFRYEENSDTLASLYNQINIDSTQTRDAHQLMQIANGAGIYTNFKRFLLKAGLQATYWDFRNMGRFRDTLEINFCSEVNLKLGKILVSNTLDFNVIGANNEFVNQSQLSGSFGRFKIWSFASFENKLPEYYMRYAYGNNLQNISGSWMKQQRLFLSANIATHFWKTEPVLSYQFFSGNNNYFFKDTTWSTDVLKNLSVQQFSLRLPLALKWFHFQPSYSFSFTQKNFQIVPQHIFLARCMVEGSLFKAKKMRAYAGVDFSLLSNYQRLAYLDNLGAFNFQSPTEKLSGYNNLHAFFGFQIDEFKFYFRFENIGILWNDRATTVAQRFSLPSQQFRLGVTWDFFN